VFCFTEIPHGSQSARAMASYGFSIGILASCPIPLVQVQAAETKMAAVGTRTASKEEMIHWASQTYPNLPWKRYPKDVVFRGKVTRRAGEIHEDQEHLADALAVVHAGVKTDQFQQMLAMWKLARAA
jgi:Holliday junction resolvasome RuvABC endonuclease subunit